MDSTISVSMPIGEALDRLSILKIKQQRFRDEKKLEIIGKEILTLPSVGDNVKELFDQLVEVNTTLWNIEDHLRMKENAKEFDGEFVFLARSVYMTNDRRFQLKTKINDLCGEKITEQKQHPDKVSKPELAIFPHLGIGDFICCAGGIRSYCEKYIVSLFVKEEYHKKIAYFFRDIPDIKFVRVVNEDYYGAMCTLPRGMDIVLIGQHKGNGIVACHDFPSVFYDDMELPRQVGFDWFFYVRDFYEEEQAYQKVVSRLGTDKYVIVHDAPGRIDIREEDLPKDCAKFFIGREEGKDIDIFHSRKLFENAQEIHCVNSSMLWFVGSCRINTKKVFHKGPRNDIPHTLVYYFGEDEAGTWEVI